MKTLKINQNSKRKMKYFSFFIFLFSFLSTSCNKEELLTTGGQNPDGTYTFDIGIDELDSAPKSRTLVPMGRYVMEMYEGDLTAEPVKETNTTGKFTVGMKKDVNYICLFWADGGEATYDVTSLQAVKQTDEAALGTAAYFANVTVNSKMFDGDVTLKRAVAELSFIDTNELTETSNTLKITYPYTSATFNLGDGTVAYAKGTTVRTIANIGPPAQVTDAFTADYILAPTEGGKLDGLKLQLNFEAEKTIPETAIKANVKTKITGKYEGLWPSMSFTIDTRKNIADDVDFIVPIYGVLSGYSLTVDWGDGNTNAFDAGTQLAQKNMTHTYGTAGAYIITISSSQKDPSKVQMPKLDFNNSASEKKNSMKLLSLNTPLLNMGGNLSSCFRGCTWLTSIPAELFANNPSATDFTSCFQNCIGLTSIPAELFANNPSATDFSSCFSGCTGLTSIPEVLFAKNKIATNFASCFSDCTGLTSIPEVLFAKNKIATNFASCFSDCIGLTSIPAGQGGIAPALWDTRWAQPPKQNVSQVLPK